MRAHRTLLSAMLCLLFCRRCVGYCDEDSDFAQSCCFAGKEMTSALSACSPSLSVHCSVGAQSTVDYLYSACEGEEAIPVGGGAQTWEQLKPSVKATVESCGCASAQRAVGCVGPWVVAVVASMLTA